MKVQVELHGLGAKPGEVREVEIPEDKWKEARTRDLEEEGVGVRLELVFYWGQNDFQPLMQRSVSMGDVARLPLQIANQPEKEPVIERYRCKAIGWGKIEDGQEEAEDIDPSGIKNLMRLLEG